MSLVRAPLFAVFLPLLLAAAPASAQVSPDGPQGAVPPALRAALADLATEHPLRVTLYSQAPREGRPVRVAADTLWLEGAGGIALADIARVEQRRSGFAAGARWSGLMGLTIGGTLGALFGIGLAELGDEGGDHRNNKLPAGMAGAAAGMMVIGVPAALIGGGIGSLKEMWYPLYPAGLMPASWSSTEDSRLAIEGARQRTRTRARLLVETGWSSGTGDGLQSSGAAYGIALLNRASPTFEYGPAFSYHALDTVVDIPPHASRNAYTSVPQVVSIGMDFRCQSAAPGARPWLDGGLGLCLASEMHLGAHLGTGYRWRDAHRRDYGLFLRRQVPFGHQEDAVAAFWTLGAAFTFGL